MQKQGMHIPRSVTYEYLTVFYRAMYLGIDPSQGGATKFSNFFLQDEEYVTACPSIRLISNESKYLMENRFCCRM